MNRINLLSFFCLLLVGCNPPKKTQTIQETQKRPGEGIRISWERVKKVFRSLDYEADVSNPEQKKQGRSIYVWPGVMSIGEKRFGESLLEIDIDISLKSKDEQKKAVFEQVEEFAGNQIAQELQRLIKKNEGVVLESLFNKRYFYQIDVDPLIQNVSLSFSTHSRAKELKPRRDQVTLVQAGKLYAKKKFPGHDLIESISLRQGRPIIVFNLDPKFVKLKVRTGKGLLWKAIETYNEILKTLEYTNRVGYEFDLEGKLFGGINSNKKIWFRQK